MMTLNGIEFDFDFTDADDLERFENAYDALQKAQENAEAQNEKASVIVRSQCLAVKAFFDEVLGEDAYAQLVQKPSSMEQNNDAIFDFVEAYTKAMQDVNAKTKKRLESFTKFTAPKRRRT
ncbi:MAG TPA: hypothetical protein H9698_10555 [Candidatus Ruthenibacterium merdavium]|uniref:DUF6673 domain-containing protein n=1 Tax=Candidatus Ruthenibacterium merdavium TaxID=2838752 RepID=A0A9D2Q5H3_9FIRM|nr:hypothetical protein [Candidatus Ruthenibacterium merdavium]